MELENSPVFDYNVFGFDERRPCWYANFKKADSRTDCKWVVGVKGQGKTEECILQVGSHNLIDDDKFWTKITSSDFGIKLIALYRDGGEESVVSWFNKEF